MSQSIKGVGPDEPIVADEAGYKTSVSPYRMDLMPPNALLHLAAIMCDGAKTHGENNWLNGTVDKHLNKALVHIFAHLAGDESDDHIGHAAWRMMAALELHLKKPPNALQKDGEVTTISFYERCIK